jgi:hypothetical protein
MGVACSTYGETYSGFWWGNLKERDLEDPGVDEIFRKWDVGLWTGSMWIKIGTGGGHL